MTKATIEKYYTVFAAIAAPIFVAYFLFFAFSDAPPVHALLHWVDTIEYPNIGVCGSDTIHFGEDAAVIEAARNESDNSCMYSVSYDTFDLLTLSISDSAFRKEYVLRSLDSGARLGRFDKTTYVYTCDDDTIYLTLNVLFASNLIGYHYDIYAVSPNNRYIIGLFGPGIDIPMALDAIKKYAYRDEGRPIAYDRALAEGFLR